MTQRWWRALWRALLASALVFLLAHVPLPVWTPRWFAFGLVPSLVFLLVCYMGKLLLDTMFYDHYQS